MLLRLASLLCLLGVSSLALPTAYAQDDAYRDDARRLAVEAASHYEKGDYQAALDLFARAAELYKAPTLVYWQARCMEGLGQLVEAEALHTRVVQTELEAGAPEAFAKAKQDSVIALEELRKRLPKLVVTVDAKDDVVKITVDGRVIPEPLIGAPIAVNPGVHTVTATRRNGEVKEESIAIEESQRQELKLSFPRQLAPRSEPIPEPPLYDDDEPVEVTSSSSWQPILGWTAIGVGVTGAAVGVVAGLSAGKRHDRLERGCPGGECPQALYDDLDEFRRVRTISTIGYAVGFVGVAAGTLLLLTIDRDGDDSASVRVSVAANQVAVSGSF